MLHGLSVKYFISWITTTSVLLGDHAIFMGIYLAQFMLAGNSLACFGACLGNNLM